LARLVEPAVCFMCKKWRVPRKAGAALMTLLIVAVILAVLWYLLSWLFWEVNGLIDNAPSLISRLPEISEGFSTRLERWIGAAPESLRDILRRGAEGFTDAAAAIPAAVVGWLTAAVAGRKRAGRSVQSHKKAQQAAKNKRINKNSLSENNPLRGRSIVFSKNITS